MKVKIFLLVMLTYIVLSYSCTTYNGDIKEVKLKRDTTIIQLTDTSFISDVRSLYFDKYLYLTDYNRDQIIILDYQGQFIKSLGMKGKGPGEFLGASHIFVRNDTIYVANDSKRSIEIYNYNSYLKTINLPPDIMLHSAFRFCFKEGSLFLTSPSDSNSIVSMNINSSLVHHLGRLLKFDLSKQNFYRNKRHLLSYKDHIIAISDNMPIIEKYDFSGKLIEQYDYSKVPLVKQRIDFIKTKVKEEKGYYLLLNDVYLKDEILYILLCTNDHDKINSNKVLAINLSKDLMSTQSIYNLGVGWYSSICVVADYLWAFNKNESGLIKFVLNE